MRSLGGFGATFFPPAAFEALPGFALALRLRCCAVACFAALALLTSQASAVVILATPENGQTTDPIDGLPYGYVGIRTGGNASVIYLGNDWALTAGHVAIGNGDPALSQVTLNNTNYTVGFTEQLKNTNNTPADLQLVHLLGDPTVNMPAGESLQIAPSGPIGSALNQSVTLVGGGGQSLGTLGTDPGGAPAYSLSDGTNIRWGTNVIDQFSVTYPSLNPGLPNGASAYTFSTTFNSNPSTTNQEALATYGDSGGGVFENVGGTQSGATWIGGTWYLVGLIDADSAANPSYAYIAGSASLAETTTIIDLSHYSSIIATGMLATPEPSGAVLGGLGAGLALLAGWNSRRKRQAALASLPRR